MTRRAAWDVGAGLIALGAGAMIVKGTVRATTGGDPSLVPWFGLGASAGLTVAASLVTARTSGRAVLAARAAMLLALVGTLAALVAVGFLVGGTIPETPDAPAAAGLSYGVMAASLVASLLVLGVLVARLRLLVGRWRWVPLLVIGLQFPAFIVAGAVGDGLGLAELTDGLGMALTGLLWLTLAYALAMRRTS